MLSTTIASGVLTWNFSFLLIHGVGWWSYARTDSQVRVPRHLGQLFPCHATAVRQGHREEKLLLLLQHCLMFEIPVARVPRHKDVKPGLYSPKSLRCGQIDQFCPGFCAGHNEPCIWTGPKTYQRSKSYDTAGTQTVPL